MNISATKRDIFIKLKQNLSLLYSILQSKEIFPLKKINKLIFWNIYFIDNTCQ